MTPERSARLADLALAVDAARASLVAAVEAWSAAVNERAGVRRAGRLLRELGYAVDGQAQAQAAAPAEGGAGRARNE